MGNSTKGGGLNSLFLLQLGVILFSLMINVMECAPESLGIPIIKSLLQGSPEGLKELVQTHSSKLLPQLSVQEPPKNAQEINKLISKLNPKQGRLDPVVVEMLSAFDRTYRDTAGVSSTESLLFPDETTSGRVASSTEENGIIWQDTTNRPQKRDRDSSKFSSKYRSNYSDSSTNVHNLQNNSGNASDHSDSSSLLPFDHITDPNIRNHRLYDWEFETYKNFTHIDQAEDLMADEDIATETKVSVAALPPPPNYPSQIGVAASAGEKYESKNGESIIPSGWTTKANGSKSKRVQVKGIPHIVISLEDTSDNPFEHHGGVHAPGYNLKLPMDSGEPSVQRPRDPLRQSSTENIVYVHGSAEDLRFPHEIDDRYAERTSHFRPSASDLSDAVFMDPEEDFYTSTVRSNDPHHPHKDDQEISSETLPKRRRKKLRKIVKKEEIDELAHAGHFSHRNGDRHIDEDPFDQSYSDRDGINYSPDYSRNSVVGSMGEDSHGRAQYNNVYHTPGPHIPIKPSKYLGPVDNSRIKSDRVLYPGGSEDYLANQGQTVSNPHYDGYGETASHPQDGGIGNYFSLHSDDPGMHSNLGSVGVNDANPYQYKNPDVTSTEYLGIGNRFQNALNALNIFGNGNNQHQTKKLQTTPTDQVIAPGHVEDFYHPYAAADDQVNQYYEDASYHNSSWSNTFFVLAAIIAFTAVFALLLPTFITSGKYGKKDHRHDLEEEDFNASTYPPGGGSSSNSNYHYDNTVDDVGQSSDIWSDVKGVYNDLVSLFRGEFTLVNKNKKGSSDDGPKIVYRDEDDHDESEEEEEDDEKNDNRMNRFRNRKRERYVKKQQLLQKQQQKRHQQLLREQQKAKKTLVSKTKVEAGRDNKDNGKTINATSVNNLVVVSGPAEPIAKTVEQEQSSPRAVTGFVLPGNGTLATMPFTNSTAGVLGIGSAADSFLREWAQVQLINHQ